MLGDDGLPDIMKIKPLIYDTSHKGYHGVGPFLGMAFSVGKRKADHGTVDRRGEARGEEGYR